MNDEQRIRVLEEELKVLKNEIKSVLLDLREQYLNIQNPFNTSMAPNVAASVGPSPEKPAAKAPVKPVEQVEEPAEEEAEEPAMFGAGSDYEEEAPGSAPLDFGNSPEMPGLNSGNGDFGLAPGLPSGDPFGGAGAAPSLGAGPGPAAGPSQADNTGDEDDDEEDDIPVVQPSKGGKKKKEKEKEPLLASGKVKYDLMVVAGLTQWIDQSTARLGKERAEALVEMSYTMGRLPENLKDVLIKMVRITKNESNGHNVTASDYLAILAQLENLLGKSEIQDNALLSLISMMKESK
jgi:hypothetical protein